MTALPKLFVVGLGILPKPGTRQSVGHFIVDSLSKRLQIPLTAGPEGYRGDKDVLVGRTPAAITLFKSRYLPAFIGPSVRRIYQKEFRRPELMLVIADSLTLPPAELHFATTGNSDGHTGIANIMACLKTPDFYRVSVGVGPSANVNEAAYLGERLPDGEREYWLGEGGERVLERVEEALRINAEMDRVLEERKEEIKRKAAAEVALGKGGT